MVISNVFKIINREKGNEEAESNRYGSFTTLRVNGRKGECNVFVCLVDLVHLRKASKKTLCLHKTHYFTEPYSWSTRDTGGVSEGVQQLVDSVEDSSNS